MVSEANPSLGCVCRARASRTVPRACGTLAALGVALLAACGGGRFVGNTATGRDPDRLERAALERAEGEIQCPPEELTVRGLGGSGYMVWGCERFVTFTCMRIPNGGFRGGTMCSPSQIGAIAPTGPATQEIAPPPTASTPVPPAPASAPATSAAEVAAARAAIDDHAIAVMACVSDPALALDVTWDAAGAMAVSVPTRAGSVEEGCVVAALAGSVVASAVTGGHILHPVVRP